MKKFFSSVWANIKKFLLTLKEIFGIHHNTKYVKGYLNEANMRSGIYMSGIIFILEAWLVIRQFDKYIIDILSNSAKLAKFDHGPFQVIFTYTSNFWLLMSFATAMFFYCLLYTRKKESFHINSALPTLIASGISIALACLLPLEFYFSSNAITGMTLVLLLALYITVFLTNTMIIISTLYKYFGGKKQAITSVLVIIFFAMTCLAFGIKVSYGDFTSMKTIDGVYQINPDYKQIICFLMMSMYVGCLLIWKPYISVSILGTIFLGFYLLLKHHGIPNGRNFPDGDEVNYITFFISLTMICISIYDQRVREARKDEELELLATKDLLTDLYSFEYFITLTKRMIVDGEAKIGDYIYLFLDITSFKIFNDQRGFDEGNAFLKSVGGVLSEQFPSALITRQSDDHFVVFTELKEDVHDKLETINNLVEKLDLDIRPGIKVGGYILREENEDPHQSVEKARYACTIIKHKAGYRYMEYDAEMHDNYRKIQYIVRHIDEAVENGYIKVYYQPVVYSKDNKLCGMEGLARWIDPKYGFMSPGLFVPALEDAQLIYKLDIAMLRIICSDIKNCLDNNLPIVPVSINFSKIDFLLLDIVSVIDETVKEFGIPKDYLHVEITESALMNDRELLRESIKRLHDNNFAVWLDDFGSGYSSFNVLKDFDFDVLKLDMEFLKGFSGNKKSKQLIQSVVEMAHAIGMKTLSEGVEHDDEAKFLKTIDCGRLQGYLFGKPVPYEEIKAKLDNKELTLSKELI